jgi:hypothetical protein
LPAVNLLAPDLLVSELALAFNKDAKTIGGSPGGKDVQDPKKAEEVYKVIRERLEKYRKERPGGYLVREVPDADLKQLKILAGHLQAGQFVTKFRKSFTKGEMNDDLVIVPAKLGEAVDASEYEEILPTSPP